MFDNDDIHYYTGFKNHSKVTFVLSTLGHAANNLSHYAHRCESLSVPNQFFLVLIKLYLHMANFQWSRMFAIKKFRKEHFITCINFMTLQWLQSDIMPSRDMTSFHMPGVITKR